MPPKKDARSMSGVSRAARTRRPSTGPKPRRRRPGATGSRGLRALLAGGDRRSLAEATRVFATLRNAPHRVRELVALADDRDALVAMRAMDVLEKLAHEHADWVQPHRAIFIGPLADSDRWEIRLQVVRALPLLAWTRREHARVVGILGRDLDHPQTFVRAWALDSLATLAASDHALMPAVLGALEDFEHSPSKALQARARQIRKRLGSR
jgi:hypothetical protein